MGGRYISDCFGLELLHRQANCGSKARTGQERTPRLLPVRAVARNCSFRFEKSFIRLLAFFSDTTARLGRSELGSLMAFSFFITSSLFCGFPEKNKMLLIARGIALLERNL